MTSIISATSFQVSPVETGQKLLATISYETALANLLGKKLEASSNRSISLVKGIMRHPLVMASHLAFARHYPLVLSPDAIWLCLIQGLSAHVNANAESLRHHFVQHEGKKTLLVRRDDFIKGFPDNPWDEVVSEFSAQIKEHIGDKHAAIVADFSTTSLTERIASEIVLMETVKEYFEFAVMTMCGIPEITLEGTVEDWQSIRQRVEKFAEFNLDWWVNALIPILDQFLAAVKGQVDQKFWRSFYKWNDSSGGPYVTGWINGLFPYVGKLNEQRNYYVQHWQQGMNDEYAGGASQEDIPSGWSKVPFKWEYFEQTFDMEFVGGFVGIVQKPDTLALRPEIGWAIIEATQSDKILSEEEPFEKYMALHHQNFDESW